MSRINGCGSFMGWTPQDGKSITFIRGPGGWDELQPCGTEVNSPVLSIFSYTFEPCTARIRTTWPLQGIPGNPRRESISHANRQADQQAHVPRPVVAPHD